MGVPDWTGIFKVWSDQRNVQLPKGILVCRRVESSINQPKDLLSMGTYRVDVGRPSQVIKSPRYLQQSTLYIGHPKSLRGVGGKNGDCFLEINMYLHLPALKFKKFVTDHSSIRELQAVVLHSLPEWKLNEKVGCHLQIG